MIQLYPHDGTGGCVLLKTSLASDQTKLLFQNAARLLSARGNNRAAEILSSVPFVIRDGTNDFNDEFSVLHTSVPLEKYEKLRNNDYSAQGSAFRAIATTVSELGHHIRYIFADLELETFPTIQDERALTVPEINKLVNKYIGVASGYLGDFSYRSHREFYADLDLEIYPDDILGTTRERFIKILRENTPDVQARILAGILQRYPTGSSDIRTPELFEEISRWVKRLQGVAQVDQPKLKITNVVVERSLNDLQELLKTTGAVSGVDRVHTALHGYLRTMCSKAGIAFESEASITDLFKKIREGHPAFKSLGPRSEDIAKILRSQAAVLDVLNPLRNKASVAHPNDVLLDEPEAMLVINSVRTILHYLDAKQGRHIDNTAPDLDEIPF